MTIPSQRRRVILGGTAVDLRRTEEVVATVRGRLEVSDRAGRHPVPLAIASANLDHIHHFGVGGASRADFDVVGDCPSWLVLLDGVPLIRRAAEVTGASWPQLAGSDLLPALLSIAEETGARVGFLGGTTAMQERLVAVLARRYPNLCLAGLWSPERRDLDDPVAAAALAHAVRSAAVDLLVVGLGKPRQERWIQRYAVPSGARILLAFGAATDFLAGTATRAPGWLRRGGLEWLYRLVKEPRRLTRRYFLQAPGALWRLWTRSMVPAAEPATTAAAIPDQRRATGKATGTASR